MITLVELFEGSRFKVFFFCLFVCLFFGFGYLLLPEVFRQQFIVLSQNWTTRTSRKAKK